MPNGYSNSRRSISEQDNDLSYSRVPGIELNDLQAREMREGSLSDAFETHVGLGVQNGAHQYVKICDLAGSILRSPESSTQSQFRGLISGPVTALLAIFARWGISDADGAVLLGKENAHYVAELRAGLSGLSGRDTKDRARLLIQIYESVHSLLRTGEQETSWLKAPLENLQGRSLIGVMLGGSVADLLLAKAYIDHANGR
jgi:hypothetical protein